MYALQLDRKVNFFWGDPGVSELQQIQEMAIAYPSATGGQGSRTLQRNGMLSRLRCLAQARLNVSAYTGAPSKSVYGVLGSLINRIRIDANGSISLIDLSGIGLNIYNDVQNQDGSTLAPVAYDTTLDNVAAATSLKKYNAIGATGDFDAQAPFELQFSLPVNIKQQVAELGLWLLQNQSIDVGVNVIFNPLYSSAASRNALWSGGTLTATATVANTQLLIERELYTIPARQEEYPDLRWAHQVIESRRDILGSAFRFEVPRAGVLLRAMIMILDSNGDPVDVSDISSLKWVYGANETPISRPGNFFTMEYVQDYGHYPPKGVAVLDFYKFGGKGLKFVKDTESLANLRIEGTLTSTTTGSALVILDRFVTVSGR